ncbi:MAG: hypothetical protein JNL11_13145 [Bdellovibrionaceae bacterium]|nr:hypothetical protein [Pseudobdellovibrionaceae bacterium]
MKEIILSVVLVFGLSSFAQTISVDGIEKEPSSKPKAPAARSSAVSAPGAKASNLKTKTNASKPQPTPAQNKNFWNQETASPIFIVQNIATEKTRVYKRCQQTTLCAHELLFETDSIVGQKTDKQLDPKVYMTRLGHFKIAKWTKFFEDKNRKFPAWYKSDYSVVPKGTSAKEWLGPKYLPQAEVNAYRGAYGWLTAQLGPNADEQVIHGTYGWASDQGNFLTYFRNPLVSFIDDPMSQGATRVENQAVAYIRHLADLGTDVLRVYALEAYADPLLARYEAYKNQNSVWEWVLTIKDAQKDSVSLDKNVQVKRNFVYSDVLDEGRFEVDRYPTGLGYSATLFGLGAGAGTTGNTYQISRKHFKGVFLVDEGRFVDYEHPQVGGLSVGGYSKPVLPAYALSKNSSFILAAPANSPHSGPR